MTGAVLGLTSGPTALWYLTRGTGIVALVLLSAVVVLGVVTSVGWTSERWPRFLSQALHRNLSLFCLLLIGLHILTTVADGFAPIGFLDAVVPFRSPYRPLWLGLGALAFDLLLVVALTSALRRRIGHRAWRGLHWLAYASWPVAVLHGLGTGTDATLGPVLLLDAVCVAAVLGAIGWRLGVGWPARAGRRLAGGAAAGAFALAAGLFVVLGPLSPHWARRAGTPTSLLTAKTTATPTAGGGASSGGAPAPVGDLPAAPFRASLAASMTTSPPDASGLVTVQVRGEAGGSVGLPFEIDLTGTPVAGGVSMSSGRVRIGAAQGPVTGLDGNVVSADVTSGHEVLTLTFDLVTDRSTGGIQGTLYGSPAGTVGAGGSG